MPTPAIPKLSFVIPFMNEEATLEELYRRIAEAVTPTLAAGVTRARGSIVFTLDADLQDDPKEIPRFLAKLEEGFDLVSGYKQKRNDPITKVLPSRVFNALVRSATGVKLHDVNCGFKAYRDVVLKNVRLYGELHRF